MTRPTLLLAAAVSLAAASASAASVAQADTYCVAKPACAAQPSGHAAADLTTALADAAAHGGPDRIEIGPGIFPYPGATPTVQYTNDITEIVGAGRDATILMGGAGQFALGVDRAGVTVSDLGITLVDNVDSKGLRLAAAGDVARRLDVDAGHPTSSSEGIGITAGATLDDVRVAMGTSSGSDGVYVYGAGGAQLDHVAITAGYPLRVNSADALTTVSHARITGAYRVAYIQSPNELAISDSVLVSASGTYEAVGVDSAGPGTTLARITRSTLVGKGVNGVVRLNQTAGAGTAKAILRGVAIVGTGAPFASTKTTGAAIFDVDASAFGPGYTPGAGDVFGAHDLGAPSGFADAAAGDFRLRPDSPLVDAGGADASALPAGATDLDGAARVVDGNGDATAQADIGAFEYQRPAAAVTAAPATTPEGAGGRGTSTEAAGGAVTPAATGSRVRLTKLRLGRDGRLRLRVTCQGAQACAGTVAVRAQHGRRRVMLARASFTLPAGGRRTVTLRIGRHGRAVLPKGRRIGVVATASGHDGLGRALGASTVKAKIRR